MSDVCLVCFSSSSKPFGYGLARRLVLCKIHRALGLDRVKLFYSGAAPLSKETLSFFHALDFPLLQVIGLIGVEWAGEDLGWALRAV